MMKYRVGVIIQGEPHPGILGPLDLPLVTGRGLLR
jgi:hypothetical protein